MQKEAEKLKEIKAKAPDISRIIMKEQTRGVIRYLHIKDRPIDTSRRDMEEQLEEIEKFKKIPRSRLESSLVEG